MTQRPATGFPRKLPEEVAVVSSGSIPDKLPTPAVLSLRCSSSQVVFQEPTSLGDSIAQAAPAAKLLPRAPAAEEQAHSDLRTFVLEC